MDEEVKVEPRLRPGPITSEPIRLPYAVLVSPQSLSFVDEQVLKDTHFVRCHFVMWMRCCRNTILVYVSEPVVKLVLLYVISL